MASQLEANGAAIDEIIELVRTKATGVIPVVEGLVVTANGTYTAPDGTDGYSPVTVNVQPKLQEKSVAPSTQAQEVTPDSEYDAMSKVIVGAVKTAEQATPSITVGANGLITAKTNQSEGYVSGGEKSATKQLPTMAGKTVTPTTIEQTVVNAGTFVTDAIKVAKIPTDYIKPTGTKSITENGTHDVTLYEAVDVNVPTSGGGAIPSAGSNDVEYIDYDGTILYSYSAAEFATLTTEPALPIRDGLICQGWNWGFAEAQAYVADYGALVVGATYITDDNKTRVYIQLKKGRLSPYCGIALNGTCIIDWGDGRSNTIVGTSTQTVINTQHIYEQEGDYIITLDIVSGNAVLLGDTNILAPLLLWAGDVSYGSSSYSNAIKKIEIGASIDLGEGALMHCYSLRHVTLPNSISLISSSCFEGCHSLKCLVLPMPVTDIEGWAFIECESAEYISLSQNVVSIGTQGIAYCYSLKKMTIPPGVTSIGTSICSYSLSLVLLSLPNNITTVSTSAFESCKGLSSIVIRGNRFSKNTFSECSGLGEIHFKKASPALAQSGFLGNLPFECIIYVPVGSLEAYTTASNYPDPTVYTYVEE